MIPCVLFTKTISKRKTPLPTLLNVYSALKEHQVAWGKLRVSFTTSIVWSNATKSLKAIAKQQPFLQAHYTQAQSNNIYAMIDPSTEQNYEQAIKSKEKVLVKQEIEFELDSNASDVQNVLRQLEDCLSKYPPKSYKYSFVCSFSEVDFGPNTLRKLPLSYTKGREEFLISLSPIMKQAAQQQSCSFIKIRDTEHNRAITANCLLEETTSSETANLAIPGKFSTALAALVAFKPKEVKRLAVLSVDELTQQKNAAAQKLAERTSLSVDEVKQQHENQYTRLSIDEQIALEHGLYQHVCGEQYSKPLPDNAANPQTKQHYLNLLRAEMARTLQKNTVQAQMAHTPLENKEIARTLQNNLLQAEKLRIAAAKAMHTNSFTSFEALNTTDPVQAKLEEYQAQVNDRLRAPKEAATKAMLALAQEKRLPYDLDSFYFAIPASPPEHRYEEHVPYHDIWVPDEVNIPYALKKLGYDRENVRPAFNQIIEKIPLQSLRKISIEGVTCVVLAQEREKIDRKKILNNAFKPLGYQTVKQGIGSVGSYEFQKPLPEGEGILLSFDFGSWRQTISARFIYRTNPGPGLGGRNFSIPFVYWTISYSPGHPQEMKITSEKLFTMAFANIAFLAEMLEKEYVPKFREALKEVSLA